MPNRSMYLRLPSNIKVHFFGMIRLLGVGELTGAFGFVFWSASFLFVVDVFGELDNCTEGVNLMDILSLLSFALRGYSYSWSMFNAIVELFLRAGDRCPVSLCEVIDFELDLLIFELL